MGMEAKVSPTEDRILRLPEVKLMTGLSKATIHRRYPQTARFRRR